MATSFGGGGHHTIKEEELSPVGQSEGKSADDQHRYEGGEKRHGKQRPLVYVLNLKLKEQTSVVVEVFENDDIGEIAKQVVEENKLPAEMKDALHIHIMRKLESVQPFQSLDLSSGRGEAAKKDSGKRGYIERGNSQNKLPQ